MVVRENMDCGGQRIVLGAVVSLFELLFPFRQDLLLLRKPGG